MAAVFERVRAIAADVFQVPAAHLKTDSSPETLQNWDSVQHLNLVLALELQFGVQFDPEEMQKMTTIGAVVELLEARMGK